MANTETKHMSTHNIIHFSCDGDGRYAHYPGHAHPSAFRGRGRRGPNDRLLPLTPEAPVLNRDRLPVDNLARSQTEQGQRKKFR